MLMAAMGLASDPREKRAQEFVEATLTDRRAVLRREVLQDLHYRALVAAHGGRSLKLQRLHAQRRCRPDFAILFDIHFPR